MQRQHAAAPRLAAALAFAAAVLLPPLAPVSAGAAAPPGFVYCLNQGGAKVFAGKRAPNGSLRFGLSVWSPTGQNISVFGTAPRHGQGWRYSDNMQADTPAERCRLDIVRGADGTLRVRADRSATCQSRGGVGAEIGTVQFPRRAYEGHVGTELDDAEAFQKAGRCASSSSNSQ